MPNIIDLSEVMLEIGLSASSTDEEKAIVNSAVMKATGMIKRYLQHDPTQATRTEFYPQSDYDLHNRSARWESEGSNAVLRRLSSVNTSELFVRHVPIRQIVNLWVNRDGRSGTQTGVFGPDDLRVEGTDFWANYDMEDSAGNSICRDGIIRSHGRWPTVPGTVKIEYVAGYSAAELHGQDAVIDASPIVTAAIDESIRLARKAFINRKSNAGWVAGPLQSERLGDYSYTAGAAAVDRMFGGVQDLMPETKRALGEYIPLGYQYAG
jgi:hypothetical protein